MLIEHGPVDSLQFEYEKLREKQVNCSENEAINYIRTRSLERDISSLISKLLLEKKLFRSPLFNVKTSRHYWYYYQGDLLAQQGIFDQGEFCVVSVSTVCIENNGLNSITNHVHISDPVSRRWELKTFFPQAQKTSFTPNTNLIKQMMDFLSYRDTGWYYDLRNIPYELTCHTLHSLVYPDCTLDHKTIIALLNY
jgi:hypothetical protein